MTPCAAWSPRARPPRRSRASPTGRFPWPARRGRPRSRASSPTPGSPRWPRQTTPDTSSWPWSRREATARRWRPRSCARSSRACTGGTPPASTSGWPRTRRDMELTAGRLIRDDRAIRHLDPVLIVTAVALAVYGLFMVYSASHQSLGALGEDPGFFLKKQLAYLLLGLVALLVAAAVDYRLVKVYAPLAWAGAVFVLLVVLTPLGSETAGAQRWITLFGFQFQPSEFAKLATTAMIAAYLSELRGEMDIEQVWRTTGLAVVPMGLVFLPEQHTDFIFTVVGEELGFVGGMFLLLLFGVLLWWAFRIAAIASDPFGRYLAVGIAIMIAFQVFVNVGMTLGIMPITGIPLPLVSYGGSALITNFIAIGLL